MSADVLPPIAARTSALVTRGAVSLWVAVLELAGRDLKSAAREGHFVSAIGAPIAFYVCFYVPLHSRFDRVGVDYAQYLVPLVILQAAIFVSIGSCEIAGAQAQAGVRDRLASLPIPRIAPLCSRMINAAVRMASSICSTWLIGWAFGFGFHGTLFDAVGFVVIGLGFALGLSLLTDAVASVVEHPDSVAQLLMVPQLLLVMVSTGLVPVQQFPDWIQPVVRNNPVSVFADAMRSQSVGADYDSGGMLAWLVVLIVSGVVAVGLAARGQVKR